MTDSTLTIEPVAPAPVIEDISPGTLTQPAFVMSAPFSSATDSLGIPWIQKLPPDRRKVDRRRAIAQFLQLYRYLASEALVFLVPTPGCWLQDMAFTANLGVIFEHLPRKDIVVISNFTSEPRPDETEAGVAFFRSMGYRAFVAPYRFEGDAELKHLHDDVYVGGYGIRSDRRTYDWMERTFGMKVIRVRLTEPYLCHLDRSVFPISRDSTLVCTELFERDELAELERHTGIIEVTLGACFSGICNSVRLQHTVLNASHILELKSGTEEYAREIAKNRQIEDVAARLGLDVSFFNLSEYRKGGALVSSMVMQANRNSYEIA